MKISLIVFSFTFLILGNCNKNNSVATSGKLRNLTGLDGCGWVIELDKKDTSHSVKLEPTNLKSFNISLKEGLAVEFTYVEINSASICMVGPVIELKSIKPR